MGISSRVVAAPPDRHRVAALRPRRAGALWLLQVMLLVAGASLLVVYAAAQADAARGREQALEAFAQARSEHAAAASLSPLVSEVAAPLEHPGDPDQSLWGATRIAAYQESLGQHREPPLGVLTIPSVELEAPIFDGTSELALNRGIGHIEGTAVLGVPGNLGLAGHRDGYFRVLKDVQVGEAIDVESLDGTTRYRITELKIVEPTDVYVLEPTDTATLTLVTCYPFYFIGEAPQRYIVKAVAESPVASSPL